ncbi:hypothetical protein CTAYLR_006854 [Chrysophaeum taylorii]|uniref:Uncharacterized protein n=1 Tax=Chrysophaeum taylorii TaxID=2483200 RepID=A0AAD7XGJ5_9STRA|nr:hypothetical protein CTAYLR_006854 [Chrysophaeum taylorii]
MWRLVCGDETGLLKVVDVKSSATRLVSTSCSQARSRGVKALAQRFDGQFLCARASGELETWEEAAAGFEDDAWELVASCPGLVGECVGLGCVDEAVVSCSDDGRVQVTSGATSSAGDRSTFDVEGSVSAFDCREGLVAVGGREHELSVWDLATSERRWRARNVPNDKLDMRRPVFVGAARFASDHELVIGTKYKELRVYDARAQRRPVAETVEAMDHAVRQLILLGGDRALVGDVAGNVVTFDLKKLRVVERLVGPAGSTRALARHPSIDTFVAAAGLDRHCHVWDTTRRDKTPIASVYCMQRLNALLWLPDRPAAKLDNQEEEEEEEGSFDADSVV